MMTFVDTMIQGVFEEKVQRQWPLKGNDSTVFGFLFVLTLRGYLDTVVHWRVPPKGEKTLK